MNFNLNYIILVVTTEEVISWSLNPFSWFRSSKECKLNVKFDLSHDHEPIFLVQTSNGFELAIPQMDQEESVLKFSEKEKLYVACPGKGNRLRGSSPSYIDSSLSLASECVDSRTLRVMGKEVLSTDLECKKKVFSTVKETDNECGNYAGKEVQLGFEVEGWHPLITICYFRKQATTLHASHILYGSTLQGAEVSSHKNYFLKGPQQLYSGLNPATLYKQVNQRKVLTHLLGDSRADYVLARSYLSRGHLSPGRDFLLSAWQHLTYFYINTAPQWQSINVGNWLRLELLLRTFAATAQQDFIVTTGTYGILEMADSNGYSKEIFLEPSQQLIPVPLLFWKIVTNPYEKSCIVFLVHNNPFIDERPNIICKNICHKYGWPTDMENVFKGYTYCCSFQDFKTIVNYSPDIKCKYILPNDLIRK